ncbi:hypothetical protein SAMN04515647_4205 [Cohaesibacter sp. ES.047]|uniref:hypothetical protein n=1 Tax=Cohaesibacter sp. ES.047 TaxID=1798205 RepID=UPI000BB72FFC|nr:hypothetical protein [Cohaesibacter sp. ES.047]SNY93884.1 hypothetical protein SAMN04515647_4205 [Cohaesibacter sp. ES.047]
MSATDRMRLHFYQQQQALAGVDPASYRGDDWYQLSASEEQVFGLTLQDMPGLAALWDCFELVLGLIEPGDGATGLTRDVILGVRQENEWLGGAANQTVPLVSSELFTQFASCFGVSNRLAHAFYYKYEFWQMRSGIISFGDE